MSDWKAGMAFDSILQTPLDYYDVTYANGHTVRYEKERPHREQTKESEPLECAKMLQEYCSKIDGCYPCMFRDKHSECRINMPIDWELEEVGGS